MKREQRLEGAATAQGRPELERWGGYPPPPEPSPGAQPYNTLALAPGLRDRREDAFPMLLIQPVCGHCHSRTRTPGGCVSQVGKLRPAE